MADVLPSFQGDSGPVESRPVVPANWDGTPGSWGAGGGGGGDGAVTGPLGRGWDAASVGVALSTENVALLTAIVTAIDGITVPAPVGGATEAEQDTGNASLVSILAKIIAAPATEAKQDTGNTSLAAIAGVDFATQTTLVALLAKVIAAPATEVKQDDGNASLAAIAAEDFATQTTLAALSAKLPASVGSKADAAALAVTQSTEDKAVLAGMSGKLPATLGSKADADALAVTQSTEDKIVLASLATKLDTVITALQIIDSMVLAAGSAVIGKVDHSTTGLGHGVKTVTVAGTDEALAGSTPAKWVTLQAQTDNGGKVAVGATGVDATVATGTGVLLSAGESITLPIDNLADVFVDATVNGEGVRYIYGS